jgi:hypothetical protein
VLLGRLGADARGAQARVGQGEGHDALLDEQWGLVGHGRTPALPGAQHVQLMALGLVAPAGDGGGVDAHQPAGDPDVAKLPGR